jgi:hypothetical protein
VKLVWIAAVCLALAGLALLTAAPAPRTFKGKITDDMCARADHSKMQMGADDAECTIACVRAHGAQYVLFDGKQAYTFADQQLPEKYAGKKVIITGSLNAKGMLQIGAIVPAK